MNRDKPGLANRARDLAAFRRLAAMGNGSDALHDLYAQAYHRGFMAGVATVGQIWQKELRKV